MRKLICLVGTVFFVATATFVASEEIKDEKAPQGMEILEVGNSRLMVPKGMRYQKKGDLVVLETSEEYVARRLIEMEEHLAKIDADQKALDEKVKQLEKTLSQKQNNSSTSN